MKTQQITPKSLVTATAVFALCFGSILSNAAAQDQGRLTQADVDRLMKDVSNWGRWGKEDQIGAINLITSEKRRAAAALVTEGVSVSLARNTEKVKGPDNANPFEHTMLATGLKPFGGQWCVDNYSVAYHGYAHTHIDALCHIFYHGKMYNGFAQEEVTEKGTAKLSIHNLKSGVFARGVLMDIPKLKGVEYLEPGEAIFPKDLEAWERKAGIKVSSGDVIFIRTGRWARRAEHGPWDMEKEGAAGLHVSCVKWLRERDVAILGSDAASDVLPSRVEGVSHPVHLLTLNAMGVHILDNCDLEALSAAAAQRRRWTFLLTVAPIPVTGGTGSPLNPIATY